MTLPDPQELLEAFSLALDLSGQRHLEHALRTCCLSMGLSAVLGLSKREREQIYYLSLLHDLGSLGPSPRTRPMMKVNGKLIEPDLSQLGWTSGVKSHRPDPPESPLRKLLPGALSPHPWERLVSFADQVEIRMSEGKEDKKALIRSSRKWLACMEDFRIWEAFRTLTEDEGFWTAIRRKNLAHSIKKERPASLTFTVEEYETFIQALSDLVDSKSYFTARHSRRVSDMAHRLSIEMGLNEPSVEEVRLAGLFHDLGKLAVPQGILDKPGRLRAEEYEVIKLHSYHTQAILEKITGFSRVAMLAGAHHERIDGKGYHRRLRGNQVSMGARILAASDAYDALTNIRPYRYGMPPDKALMVIGEEEGDHFDPEVLEALRRVALG